MNRTREEVLEKFPEAVFMPWDEPPLGLRVRRLDSTLTGMVVGKDEDKVIKNIHVLADRKAGCPTCTCEAENPLYGWWIIEFDGYKERDGTPPRGTEYPPYWVPIDAPGYLLS